MIQRTCTPRDVADALGVKPVTVRAWAAKGQIPCSITLGGHRRFNLDEVRRAVNHGVLPERHSAVAIAQRIAGSLDPTSGVSIRYSEDAALRAVVDLRDALRRADPNGYRRLATERPAPVGDPRWDAFVAAVVEDEGERKGVPPPRWVAEAARFVRPEWCVAPYPGLLDSERATSPAAYLRHGVVAGEDGLASV